MTLNMLAEMVCWILLLCTFFARAGLGERPPETMPEGMDFLLGGTVPLAQFYVDDSDDGQGTHYQFPRVQLEKMVAQAEDQMARLGAVLKAQTSHINSFGNALSKRQQVYAAMYLHQHLIKDRRVCVFGSMEPWVEAALIALGAEHVLVVEYNRLTYNHTKITTVSAPYITDLDTGLYSPGSEYAASFHLAVSISSFDHDGLGRYSDPLHATGDLRAMRRVKRLLTAEGRLILTVPLGPDVVVWNLHRRYGVLRLPLLLEGWVVEDTVSGLGDWPRGGNGSVASHRLATMLPAVQDLLTKECNWRQTVEPVFLLSQATTPDFSRRHDEL